MKKAGLLLTGKAKKEADRLAAIRQQMLRTAGDAPAGLSPCSSVRWLTSHLTASAVAAEAADRLRKYTMLAGHESWRYVLCRSRYSSQAGNPPGMSSTLLHPAAGEAAFLTKPRCDNRT